MSYTATTGRTLGRRSSPVRTVRSGEHFCSSHFKLSIINAITSSPQLHAFRSPEQAPENAQPADRQEDEGREAGQAGQRTVYAVGEVRESEAREIRPTQSGQSVGRGANALRPKRLPGEQCTAGGER